jgi:hypothetical protein
MLCSISVKKDENGDLLIGFISSFDRHLNKYWIKQSIVSKEFLKKRSVKKSKDKKKSKHKKGDKEEAKEKVEEELLMSFQKFFELKLANIFGTGVSEFKSRVCKLPIHLFAFINEENCYYGCLYDKIFRSVFRKLKCNTNLITIKHEPANLSKNKMMFSFCNIIKDVTGDTYKYTTQMNNPGFCIDKDIVPPINEKLKLCKNKRYHQFYLNPICGDINDQING